MRLRRQARTTVFTIYLEQLLTFGSLPDDVAFALGVQVRSDEARRHVIRRLIAPYFARWDDESKQHGRNALALALLENDEEWMRDAWEADLPPFDLTDPPRRFYELLWEELFGDLDPAEALPNFAEAEIDVDPAACNRIRVRRSSDPDIPDDVLPVRPGEGAPTQVSRPD